MSELETLIRPYAAEACRRIVAEVPDLRMTATALRLGNDEVIFALDPNLWQAELERRVQGDVAKTITEMLDREKYILLATFIKLALQK